MQSKNYRVVNIEILTSPCRKCSEAICNRTACEKLAAFQLRCDQELPSYGVCNFEEDELSTSEKVNINQLLEYEEDGPVEEEAEFVESSVIEKTEPKQKPVPKAKSKPVRELEQKTTPAPVKPVISDIPREQVIPVAALQAPQKLVQLSLF